MSSQLPRDLVEALQLEQRGVEHPGAIITALEFAHEELSSETRFEPRQFFSVENTILQAYNLPNRVIQLQENDGLRIIHNLLHFVAHNRNPNRVIHFNYHSGQTMVAIHTFNDCNTGITGASVSSFSIATLFLDDHDLLSVIFAHVI